MTAVAEMDSESLNSSLMFVLVLIPILAGLAGDVLRYEVGESLCREPISTIYYVAECPEFRHPVITCNW